MPIEQSSSLLEQYETRAQKPKGLFQRINDTKQKSLYALTLALGSLAGGASTAGIPETQTQKVAAQTIDDETDAEAGGSEHKDEGMEQLVTDLQKKTLTCTYQGLPISGHINDQGEVVQVTLENAQIDLTESVTTKSLEPFLYRALKSLDNIRAHMTVTGDLHLTSLGGARFFFTIERESDRREPLDAPSPGGTSRTPTVSSLYVATANDVFLVDSDHEEGRTNAEKSLAEAQENLQQSINDIAEMQKERHQLLDSRRANMRSTLTQRMNREPRHYQSWWQWKRTLDREEREYSSIVSQYKSKDGRSTMTQNEYRAIQIKEEDHITFWEKYMEITVDEEGRAAFEEKYKEAAQERDAWQQKKSESRSASLTRVLHDEKDDRLITEVTNPITPKNFERRWEEDAKGHHQKYEDNQLIEYGVYHGNTWGNYEKYWYHTEGPMRWKYEYAPDEEGKLAFTRSTGYWMNEHPSMIHDKKNGVADYYTYTGKQIVTEKNYESTSQREVLMYDDDGTTFGTYATEQKKNPKLTLDGYIDLLAYKLNTLEKLHCFLMSFMEYTSDQGDHWQTPEETIQRIKNGKTLGDCDDYAFLSREILRRQGKNARAIYIPGHIICVWAEKDTQDHHNAWSICTYGLDTNGNRYGTRTDASKTHGYAKIIDALNALMKKYKYAGLGVAEGQDYSLSENAISLCEILPSGERKYYTVDADYFLKPVQ